MNTLDLITKAFYLSGILSRDFEAISDTQTTDGLELLNEIISERSMTASFIPYFSHETFDTVQGQEVYEIPGLIDISEFTFNINNVRFPMKRDSQKKYFGSGRVDDVKSLPFHYYAERQLGKMLIYLYFVPDKVYQMKITGKYALQDLELFDDLSTVYDKYYISYLKYKLASRVCDFYGQTFPPSAVSTLVGLEGKIDKLVGTDLSITRDSMFRHRYIGYGQANLGRGYTT